MDAINALLGVQSWPQVIVILGGLGYLAFKAYINDKKTDQIVHQVQNNSGSTMKDAIDRTEKMLLTHLEESADDRQRLDALEGRDAGS